MLFVHLQWLYGVHISITFMKMIGILVLYLFLIVAGTGYVLWHIWNLLPFSLGGRYLVLGLCLLAIVMIIVNFSPLLGKLPLDLSSIVYETGDSTIFILLYLVMLFLALDFCWVIGFVPKSWLYSNGKSAMVITVLMIGIFGYGNWHYYEKVRQPVRLTTKKTMTKDLKIVMLSDLHLGYHNRRTEFSKWVDVINAEHPDLILFGGDIVDISVRPLIEEKVSEEFRRFNAPLYACLGNHEYFSGKLQAKKFYREAGITLLCDSVVKLQDVTIIGRDDRSNPHRKPLASLMQEIDKNDYLILLDHQPYHLEEAEDEQIDFQFSGHTHHGQVWPISWITEALYEDAFGPLTKGQTQYYVSSGMGIWGGKFRIGTRSEYVVVTISHQ